MDLNKCVFDKLVGRQTPIRISAEADVNSTYAVDNLAISGMNFDLTHVFLTGLEEGDPRLPRGPGPRPPASQAEVRHLPGPPVLKGRSAVPCAFFTLVNSIFSNRAPLIFMCRPGPRLFTPLPFLDAQLGPVSHLSLVSVWCMFCVNIYWHQEWLHDFCLIRSFLSNCLFSLT
jgi:hypothetical protein